MSCDFTKSVNRRDSKAEKWSEKNIEEICGNRKALPFWVADMDLPVSDEIKNDLIREADRGVIGYRESGDLKPLFISFMKERHNTVLDPDKVAFAQGMLHAIALALNLFTHEDDKVLLVYPSYHPFIDMIENNHRVIVPFRLDRSGNGFSFDCERYREESRDCSAVLFCSPHNPTGIVFSEAELECVLTSARERGQIVLCDEIHSDLSYPSFTHTPLIRANDGIGARCITFSAASKSFNIAGEHCAFASFSHKSDRQAYERWQKRLYLTSPGYSVSVMAEAAYRDGLEYNRALCRDLSRKAEKVRSFIKENCPLLAFCTPHASFIAFIDCSAILDKVIEDRNRHPEIYGDYYLMSHFFGQRGGICMNDGTWFGGEDYKAYVRFNFGCGDDLLDKGLEGIKKAYDYITKQ